MSIRKTWFGYEIRDGRISRNEREAETVRKIFRLYRDGHSYQCIADTLGVPLKACHIPSDFLAAISDYDFEGSLIADKACTVNFDNTKIKRAVPEFRADIRADQGIRQTVQHILAHPELQTPDPEFDAWCDRVIAAFDGLKGELAE